MKSILVVGLVTVDLIYYLNKLPNKGIKYVSKKQIFSTGGNACNASIAISRLGGSATFVGSIGNDFFGHFIIKELKKENINTDHLLIKNNINTSNSSITIDNNGERQIVNFRSDNLDFDQNNFIEKNIFNAYLKDGRWKNARIFILNEYGGLYCDTDIHFFKNIEDLINNNNLPLLKEKYSAVIDNVGGDVLQSAYRQLEKRGNIYLIGNVAGEITKLYLLPFILRGIKLVGVNAEMLGEKVRRKIFIKLVDLCKNQKLSQIYEEKKINFLCNKFLVNKDRNNLKRILIKL